MVTRPVVFWCVHPTYALFKKKARELLWCSRDRCFGAVVQSVVLVAWCEFNIMS